MWDNCIVRGLDCMGYPFSCSTSCTNAFFQYSCTRQHLAEISAGEMGLHPTKLEEMARSAVILRISMAKRHVAAGINSLSTTNEKRTIQAQRDFLKREQSKPEHKAPKRYIEVGTNSLHLNTANYIPVSPRQPKCPAAADSPG